MPSSKRNLYVTRNKQTFKRQKNDDNKKLPSVDDEAEIDNHEDLIEILKNKGRHVEEVYMNDNHIYFRTRVSQRSVDELIKCIENYRKEFENLKKESTVMYVTPKPLYLHISSQGGDVHAGYMAYDYIKMSTIPIHTVVEGMAASMATTISVAGQKRYILPSAFMLIHQLRGGVSGRYDEIIDTCDHLDQLMKYDVDIYVKECKGKATKKQIEDLMSRESVIDAKKCIKMGFADEFYTGQN